MSEKKTFPHVVIRLDPRPSGLGHWWNWRCECGAGGWRGHHESESDAIRASIWHTHNRHGGPRP